MTDELENEADEAHKHHPPAPATGPSFSCDGTTCTYTVTGLTPSTPNADGTCNDTCYSARFVWASAAGGGRNIGETLIPADASGVYSYSLPEAFLLSPSRPGTMTAWLTNDPEAWGAPVVPGTKITTTIS